MNKKLVSGLAVAASMALAAGPALAAPPDKTNSVEYWSTVLGYECEKIDDLEIPYWESDGYYLAVIAKGGSVDGGNGPGIQVYSRGVIEGQMVYAPLNAGGQQADISWLMLCEPQPNS